MNNEYVIWGIPKGKKYEEVLHTGCETMAEAKKVSEILEKKYKCTEVRIQVLNLNQPWDSVQSFLNSVNK